MQKLHACGIQVDTTGFTKEQYQKLIALLYTNRNLFTSDLSQLPGTDLVTHYTIDTGSAKPIR